MSRLYNVPIELKLINASLKDRIVSGLHHRPKAYAVLVDSDSSETTLASCVAFNCVVDRNDIMGSFSCTLSKANTWNRRTTTYSNLISLDNAKRIKIYYGETISGSDHYVQVFTGVITEKPESYAFGSLVITDEH